MASPGRAACWVCRARGSTPGKTGRPRLEPSPINCSPPRSGPSTNAAAAPTAPPRIHAELRLDHGVQVARKRVARLMRTAGLVGCHRRRRGLTRRDPQAAPAPDLVGRAFTATAPNHVWTADITYVPTWSGWLYLAVVLDVYSRRVVGWAMADHLRTELVVNALDMAIWNRRPQPGLVHHSDQ